MGVVFCAAGIWMIIIGRREKDRLQRLNGAMPIHARILGTRTERSSDARDLWVHLEFEAGGRTVDKEVSVSTPFFKKAKQGGYTRVKYDPENPADFIIAGIGVAALGITGLFVVAFGA